MKNTGKYITPKRGELHSAVVLCEQHNIDFIDFYLHLSGYFFVYIMLLILQKKYKKKCVFFLLFFSSFRDIRSFSTCRSHGKMKR